jgi:hypothetical protein
VQREPRRYRIVSRHELHAGVHEVWARGAVVEIQTPPT